jgi:hypothetical protein
MPKRLALIALAVTLVTVFLFQLSTYSVSAVDKNGPTTFANLVGKITYKQLGRLLGNTQRIMPAEDVEVTVQGFFDRSKKFTVTTDASGNYSLDVPAGLYSVEVDDDASDKTDFFTPPFTVKRVQEAHATQANFQGLVFGNSFPF